MQAGLQALMEMLAEIRLLDSVTAVLQWDQETGMPPAAGGLRARQLAWLSRRSHDIYTSHAFFNLLEKLVDMESGSAHDDAASAEQRRLLYLAWRRWKRHNALGAELVSRIAEHESRTQQAWTHLRPRNDYSAFAPLLREMLDLKRREAEAISLGPTLYDSLLDAFEPGMTASQLERIFATLAARLVPLIARIQGSSRYRDDDPFLPGPYAENTQEALCREVLVAMGLDMQASRLARSAHPFTIGINPRDVRLTTRFNPGDFRPAFFAAVHEGGHALYEQGLKLEPYGSPLEEAASMGLHESQSRVWENQVARGRPFWNWFLPRLRRAFPQRLDGIDLDTALRGVNRVQPGLIRVEADEVTYTLHIIMRFELERDLINGRLDVDELPEAWNARSEFFLKLRPPDDRDGVMQDVHWAFGGFGYFPSYALGNIYAAALLDRARRDLPDLDNSLAEGRLTVLTQWLRRHVHSRGSRLFGADLVADLTGAVVSAEPYLDYLETKYSQIYVTS